MRKTQRPALTPVDRAILRLLATDARMPNKAIAEAVGIAPSTCLTRIRALRERGVIRGSYVDVDLASLGFSIQAMIAVRLHSHTKTLITSFAAEIPALPGVLTAYHLAGVADYLLHVAASDTDALREFVLEHLTAHPAVAHAETSLIFGSIRGSAAKPGTQHCQ